MPSGMKRSLVVTFTGFVLAGCRETPVAPNDPEAMADEVRAAVWAVDANLPIYSMSTMESVVRDRIGGFAVIGYLMGAFALISLLLGAVGIYGVALALAELPEASVALASREKFAPCSRMRPSSPGWAIVTPAPSATSAPTIASSVGSRSQVSKAVVTTVKCFESSDSPA